MARNTKWDKMRQVGIDMVTCNSASCDKAPHRLQRKDLEAHYDAMAARACVGDGMFAYSGSDRGRSISPKRVQRKAGASSGGRGWWNR